MLVTGKEVLDKANLGNYAIGAFNFVNMEMLQAIISAAQIERSPVIVQTSEGAIKYAGLKYLYAIAKVASKADIPVVLHLDHGKDIDIIKRCIDIGYTSVMIDASSHDFEKNVELTKQVVKIAHEKNISVEAEIGTLAGVEDNVSVDAQLAKFSDPDEAEKFAKETMCDSLAIAIGTSHGMHKFKGETKLNYDILHDIKSRLRMPLVLHGASGIPKEIVEEALKYGAKFEEAHGVDDESIKRAVAGGINKINVDSDLRLCFIANIRKVLEENRAIFDIRKIILPAKKEMIELIRHKIRIFGSANKA